MIIKNDVLLRGRYVKYTMRSAYDLYIIFFRFIYVELKERRKKKIKRLENERQNKLQLNAHERDGCEFKYSIYIK